LSLAEKLVRAQSHADLAGVLQKTLGEKNHAAATAVQDSLGLWHISPGGAVVAQLSGFVRPGRSDRIAFAWKKKSADIKILRKEFTEAKPVVQLKLHSIDLIARLRRLELLAKSEDKFSSKQLQETRRKARAEFEKKLNLFGRYSHDLKTPFSTLISSLEGMVLTDDAIPSKLRLNLETIRGAIYAVLRMAGQSMDAARLLTQKRRATLIPYNFSDFVSEIVEVYAIVFESYGLTLKTEIEGEIPAEIDPIQMEKVLNNLLNNAIKHNIPGGLAHVALKADRAKIELKITDTGLGLAAKGEKVKDLNPWNLSSHGYGLEIVRELVRTNRGRLHLKSEGGVGTTVTVTLPAVPELKAVIANLRRHNFQTTLHEVEYLASERTRLSRRRRSAD
jgi:signal transduction histidine kinase